MRSSDTVDEKEAQAELSRPNTICGIFCRPPWTFMKSRLALLILSCSLHWVFLPPFLVDPQTQAEVFRQQALTLSRNKEWDEAIKKYQEALQLEPNDADTHYNLALVFKYKGNARAAAESFQAALRLRPAWAEAHYGLGAAYYDLKNL